MDLLDNEHDPGLNIEQVLDRYETFHHLTRDNLWGKVTKVPWPCSCPGSHRNCVCKHGTLYTSIADSKVHVPKDYVAAEPSLRKKTQKLRGADGPKRARLLAERRKETEKKESKLQCMDMEGSGGSSSKSIAIQDLIIPEVTMPSSDDEDFIEVATDALPPPYSWI